MKATIVFDKMPSFRVDGKEVGRIQQIDLDLKDNGEIAIDKIHVSERARTYIPGVNPGKSMLAPWEEDQPVTPDHPRIHKIPDPFGPKPEDVISPR